jgi:hypothetical protein
MKTEDFINKGYGETFPVFYNKTTVIDYNLPENQQLSSKKVSLPRYGLNSYQAYKSHRPVVKIA